MIALQTLWPRKAATQKRGQRWMTNFGLLAINTVLLRLIFPLAAVGAALFAAQRGWGALNQFELPAIAAFFITIVMLDLAIWGQHLATHKVPLLWRLHRVHHVDRDIDVTTGVRFHPAEILLSMGYKLAVVAALGAPAEAVILYEILLSSFALFNHSNVALPLWLDRLLRAVIVTPDMHRVHHSLLRHETDSNYGNFLSVWDRLFRTYIAQPEAGHDGVIIGLPDYQIDDRPSRLGFSLLYPFRKR